MYIYRHVTTCLHCHKNFPVSEEQIPSRDVDCPHCGYTVEFNDVRTEITTEAWLTMGRCTCGSDVFLSTEATTFGNGDLIRVFWVESPCGMKGKSFNNYGISDDAATEKAVSFWNNHMTGLKVKAGL